jgi:ABC-type dipeptide/oligopeptide/nickel transport system ATPase component
MNEPLLRFRISVDYPQKTGVLTDFSLEINDGEIVGLVGPSGEGKSTVAWSILGLLGRKGGRCRGEILFRGRDLLDSSERDLRHVRGKSISLVPQSPAAALNPHLKLSAQIDEAWRAHERGKPETAALMSSVSLPSDPAFLRQYPRSLSVGMAQRFVIALAILHRPALLLADESTSALDTITQAEILALFARLRDQYRIAILYISHDLASVASLCDRVAILKDSKVVEEADAARIFREPRHDYTRQLIAAIPRVPESDSLSSLANGLRNGLSRAVENVR